MKTSTQHAPPPSLAATVAAEDLQIGDLVSLLNETWEYPSFLWCGDSAMTAPHEPVRIRWRARTGGAPLKVRAICLPFVFLEDPQRQFQTIDLRQCELVRLERKYARLVWKQLRQQRSPSELV